MLGAFSVAFVLAALPAGLVGTRLGKVRAMSLGLATLPLVFLALTLLRPLPLVAAALVLAGFAWALVNVQAYPLVADLGGRDRIGFFTGLYYLASMAAAVVSPAIAGLAMDLFGLSALFPVAATGVALGFVALQRARRLGLERATASPPD